MTIKNCDKSRRPITTITSTDQLPRHYANGLGFPRQDWRYWQQMGKALRGGVFLDGGTIRNAEHARQRLVKAGFMQDHTKGGTDEDN